MKRTGIMVWALLLAGFSSAHAQWSDNGSSLTTLDKVGIGTSNPVDLLHVNNPPMHIFSGVNVGSITINSGQGNLFQFFGSNLEGSTGQLQGGFGIARGPNMISPIVWMYNYNNRNAFQVRKKNYSGTVQNGQVLFHVGANGRVGIGTTTPAERFAVNGAIKAEEVIVVENVGADFVFDEDYKLPSLNQVEAYIKQHNHLPEIPSAKEMKKNGVKMGALQMKLLQKIEELTLYMIELKKENEQLKKYIDVKLSKQQ